MASEGGGFLSGGLLLAESFDGSKVDATGWWMSEKLDGVRAYWDGQRLYSRNGHVFPAPESLLRQIPPDTPLDGELWLGRGLATFQQLASVVKKPDAAGWQQVSYVLFDAPCCPGPFERRLQLAAGRLATHLASLGLSPTAEACRVRLLEQTCCRGADHLRAYYAAVDALGGEGVCLRQPQSLYERRRSSTLLKVKGFVDEECLVLGVNPSPVSLQCQRPNGVQFKLGTGLTNALRERPPPIHSVVTYRCFEYSDKGVPRFPVFVAVRSDLTWQQIIADPATMQPRRAFDPTSEAKPSTPKKSTKASIKSSPAIKSSTKSSIKSSPSIKSSTKSSKSSTKKKTVKLSPVQIDEQPVKRAPRQAAVRCFQSQMFKEGLAKVESDEDDQDFQPESDSSSEDEFEDIDELDHLTQALQSDLLISQQSSSSFETQSTSEFTSTSSEFTSTLSPESTSIPFESTSPESTSIESTSIPFESTSTFSTSSSDLTSTYSSDLTSTLSSESTSIPFESTSIPTSTSSSVLPSTSPGTLQFCSLTGSIGSTMTVDEVLERCTLGERSLIDALVGLSHDEERELLHLAALHGDVRLVKELLALGANPFAVNGRQWTARHCLLPGVHTSKARRFEDIRQLLTAAMTSLAGSDCPDVPAPLKQAMRLDLPELRQLCQDVNVPNYWLGNLMTLQEKLISHLA